MRIPVAAAETGGSKGRTVRVAVDTGRVTVARGRRPELELYAGCATEVASMSGQVLSPDAIAALVDAAKEGRLPDGGRAPSRAASGGCARSTSRARPSSPPTRSAGIKRALDTFCRTASTRLSAELRMSLELEVISVNQLTWSNAHGQVPAALDPRDGRRRPARHAHAPRARS